MAKIEDLIAQIPDERLRKGIAAEVKALKRTKKFGLVFEEHLPETVRLPKMPVKPGELVALKREGGNERWRVKSLRKDVAVCDQAVEGYTDDSQRNKEFKISDLVVVRSFGEPIYPALSPVDRIERGGPDKPWHLLINADNFHALQLLLYCYEGKVDVIYIDPPYNTGARDWKYNNDYVDKSDSFRHSKWLSMIKKRLLLAKRLLAPTGVLIVTIDENEVHHLAVLLEELFPNALRQMVTICINPSGVSGDGLSRVEEYALFCFCGGAQPNKLTDDLLNETKDNPSGEVTWESLLRRGNAWYRAARKNLCYAVLIDPKTNRIVGVSEPLEGPDESRRSKIDGKFAAWPVRTDHKLGIWRVDGKKLMQLVGQGYAYASSFDEKRGTWSIKYLMEGSVNAISSGNIEVTGTGQSGEVLLKATQSTKVVAKTVWHRGKHIAGGSGGTQILTSYLGERDLFSFPKSVYAVADTLEIAAGHKKDAVIIDFFAGSGTTYHATCLLNQSDQGKRQCVLVTNNEVKEGVSGQLAKQGIFPGSPEFEKHGIAERVSWPRCKAVATGKRPDGSPVEGSSLGGRDYAQGFDENIEYFHLDFLEPAAVARGDAFQAILPVLWVMAGCQGRREDSKGTQAWFIPKHSPFAVLIREKEFRAFKHELEKRPDIEWVFLVTDAEENFAAMRRSLGRKFQCVQLYKNYLENFRLNTPEMLTSGGER